MSADLVTCTMCRGTGKTFYLCANDFIPCSDCKGAGKREPRPAEWLDRGNKLRANRIIRGASLCEEAKRLGISAADLSAMERGRMEPIS